MKLTLKWMYDIIMFLILSSDDTTNYSRGHESFVKMIKKSFHTDLSYFTRRKKVNIYIFIMI